MTKVVEEEVPVSPQSSGEEKVLLRLHSVGPLHAGIGDGWVSALPSPEGGQEHKGKKWPSKQVKKGNLIPLKCNGEALIPPQYFLPSAVLSVHL